MVRIVHLTSVHVPFDVRIFHRQCRGLAEAGHVVTLVAPHVHDELIHGVRIRAVPLPANRWARLLRTGWQVYRIAVREKADIYHVHDPELILYALLLRYLHRTPVIYDVHEDYVSSILQKPYLPHWSRQPLATLFSGLEAIASRCLTIVVAERYYLRRFPGATPVLNYPSLGDPSPVPETLQTAPPRLLYTGVMAQDRGSLIHAGILRSVPEIELHMVGQCPPRIAEGMLRAAGDGASRLFITGIGEHVPHGEIIERYLHGPWVAGLALFPPTPHYEEKELTKFFEYMWAGIPVLCSNVAVWRSLIEGLGAGLTVDPTDEDAIAAAVHWLLEHPKEAHALGVRGQQAVRDRYNWSSQAAELSALYERLLIE